MQLNSPYLIFLGGVTDPGIAKTAFGLLQWAPEFCLAQYRFPSCTIDLGLPDTSIKEAKQRGAQSLVLGCAPPGGGIEASWLPVLLEAIEAGLDIVSGFHTRLNAIPELTQAAQRTGVRLVDIRVPPSSLPTGTGAKRSGKRLLTVGTDCAVGKKYSALAITRAMKARGLACDFRATGQTGIMIAGGGIPIDAVVADFIAGAAEQVSPNNDSMHWDIIEGQGSLFHPAYAGVSLGLLHGSQPDALVVCHDPCRPHIIGLEQFPVPDIQRCIERNLEAAMLTNAAVSCVGVCVNTVGLEAEQRVECLANLSEQTGLPCVDPLVEGVEAIVDRLVVL